MSELNILQINGGSTGSTGKIMFGIKKVAEKAGYEVCCASPVTLTNRNRSDYHAIGNSFGRKSSVLLSRITGLNGCFAVPATVEFLRYVSHFRPSVIHLHNLHDSYINIPMLFDYIRKNHIPVVWTLHDCWAFTGHCPHFIYEKCFRWKDGCHDCPRYEEYPKSFTDNSQWMWKRKKEWFTGVENMTIVTPSGWLANLVKQSFLKEYPVQVIHNGIDLKVFKPTESDFREKYQIAECKKIILGTAFEWGVRKGLDVFVELAGRLDREKYQIVLVGTSDTIDKLLPGNIISVHRTQNQKQLAEIYTAADMFVNPTREDNYPTVNMEALACGTPVITFNTGGSPEIPDEACGVVVPCDDTDAMERTIVRICESGGFDPGYMRKYRLRFDDIEK